jgi:hypothetical protein
LCDRRRNGAFFDRIQCLRIVVKRHDGQFPSEIEAVRRLGRAGPSGRLQADNPIDLFFLEY